MSTIELKLDAEKRTDLGKGASRRLRRAKKIPAIVYGGGKDAVAITLAAQQVLRLAEEEAFYSQILELKIDGKAEQVVLKDMQRHAFKPLIEHLDLQRVVKGQKMVMHVPFHFLNAESAKGVKLGGGRVNYAMIELEVECLPQDLPDNIEVDLADMDIGDILHVSDITLPKGVVSRILEQGAEHDQPVVSIRPPRGGVGDEGEGEEGEGAEEAGEE
ncbi:50S ribosomal protein L25/general stress protein Ctc [Alkalilimnicola sp. S0819]|uniref:50S ribosomal protein L25/general stress protein Ctc n=1 Tax=Alkalilimnicola sp. S0819 TaxID=2613922 RepID=UPI0012625012|nr:50S ribosomal protein L25/general stress protein Ctc [Alkalilimnicola sp. S0819]KAB7623787.1 50S ribosomal protein L25/general stress protein Ctc [Alkalilimnicola sp. S0819]MPQ16661.1 50S ribosomal protein L25/general stress protein Ctc [Alkalilimnicola sp. S0819]